MSIKKFHESNADHHRNIVIIPQSAHGTNPASSAKMGLKPVIVKNLPNGYIDLEDCKKKVEKHKKNICALMITYPSTCGVFEEHTKDVIATVREAGGKVYIDGANMNAHFFTTSPGYVGDVCHLNLHKSFCIPHGGGGPGHGPVLCKSDLAPFLPSHIYTKDSAVTRKEYFEAKGP